MKIEIFNSKGDKSSALSVDPIPFSKIANCSLFILRREVLDNMENLAALFSKIEVSDNFERESFK